MNSAQHGKSTGTGTGADTSTGAASAAASPTGVQPKPSALAALMRWMTDGPLPPRHLDDDQEPEQAAPKRFKNGNYTVTNQQSETDDSGRTTSSTGKSSIGTSGLVSDKTQTVTAGTGDETTSDTKSSNKTIDTSGLTVGSSTSASNGSGASTTTTGSGQSTNISGSGLSSTRSSTTGTGTAENGTSTTSSSTFTGGPSGVGISRNTTTTTTTEGEEKTNSSGYGASYNPTDGSATATGNVKRGDAGVEGSLNVSANSVDASGTASYKDFSAGLTYQNQHGLVSSSAVSADDSSMIAQSVGKSGYVEATRTDQTTIGGSLDAKYVSVSGSLNSGSTLQSFDKLPANWDKMDKDDRKKFQDGEEQRLAKLDGLADVKLLELFSGSGVHYSSFNGWNASAGITYGAVGASEGIGSASAHDVNIERSNDKLSFTVQRKDDVSNSVGVSVFSKDLTVSQDSSKAHQFQFDVDPTLIDPMNPRYNAETAKAILTFQQTGLYPGAEKLSNPESKQALQKFQDSRAQVDTLNAQITQLNQQLASPGPAAPDATAITQNEQRRTALCQQLDDAQKAIDTNRNYLNDLRETIAQPGQELAPGITISQTSDIKQNTSKLSAAGQAVAETDQTWVDTAYTNAQNQTQNRYSYDEKHLVFGTLASEQSVQTDTDTGKDAMAISMYSDNELSYGDNAQAVKSIRNKNLPDYMLTDQNKDVHSLRGQTTVTLTSQTLNAMTSSLNDISNPQSQQLWQDLGQRASAYSAGGNFMASSIAPAGATALRTEREGFISDLYDPRKLDPTSPWHNPKNDAAVRALGSYGATEKEQLANAAADFQKVTSPAEFQKLSPDRQQLFITFVEQTGGSRHSVDSDRNAYEALAPIALINDPKARAQSTRALFEEENDQAHSRETDGVYEFVKYTEQFKNQPELFNALQKSMSFNWQQNDVENLAKQDEKALIRRMNDDEDGAWGRDSDNELWVLEAANQQGGKAEVARILQATGTNEAENAKRLEHNPAMQQMYTDLVNEATNPMCKVDPNSKP